MKNTGKREGKIAEARALFRGPSPSEGHWSRAVFLLWGEFKFGT